MSAKSTRAHVLMEQAAQESRHQVSRPERPSAPELLQRGVPEVFFIPQAGPPLILLLGPWLILVLLIIPPAAFLLTIALLVAVAGGLVFALGALIASPYLLARHLYARHDVRASESEPAQRRRFAFAALTQMKGTS